ncbi:MAG: S-methyl-5-thioribose-1-phosphate isomerase [Planctomycetota bacterium]
MAHGMREGTATPLAVEWIGDARGVLRLIDQTRLPTELIYMDCRDPETVWEAIKMLRVRGAPAIGVAAAMGLVLGAQKYHGSSPAELRNHVHEVADYLRTSRPTAVNLFWALDRMERAADALEGKPVSEIVEGLWKEAQAIREEDRAMCAAIGRHGAELISDGAGVLTHCNAGALATSDYGTALSVFFHAHAQGKRIKAFVDETRPLLQGSRLTAWELITRGVPATLLCDNMAGVVMQQGKVDAVVVGADRIAANGDTANKIGTYSVAVLAQAHGVPFYVAAPSSTFDFSLASGAEIPIEYRDPKEITHGMGKQTAPEGVDVFNPAFDVTPARLIAGFITEEGVIRPPYLENLERHLRKSP